MATSFYTASSAQRISHEVADKILSVTREAPDLNERVFTPEFMKKVSGETTGGRIDGIGEPWVRITDNKNDKKDVRPTLWIGCVYDDYLNHINTARLFHIVLKELNSSEVVCFDWIEGCSKPRVSEVVGGVGCVTAVGYRFLSTKSLIRDILKSTEVMQSLPWSDSIYVNPAEG